MDNSKPLVIVLSRNYSTGLGVIRSLGSAGYEVDLVASTKKKGSSIIASSSKYVRHSVEVLSPKIQGDHGQDIIDVLMEYDKEYEGNKILFPADDFTAKVVAFNQDALKGRFFMPGIISDAEHSFRDAMKKTFQAKLAREAGLLTPAEWVVSLREEEIIIPEDITYPCFVKPLQSVSGSKSEMKRCVDAEDLQKHLQKMKEFYSDRNVLVQEYLEIDKEYDLSGICLDQEIIIPGLIEKTRIAQFELGVTMCGKMISLDVLGDIKDKIYEMLKKLRYQGMFDMELCVCGDKIYFNEVNLRSGGPNFSYFLNGVNLPDILVREMMGEGHAPEEEKIKAYGKSFVYEKVAWEDFIHSYMTKQELKACIEGADHKLLDYAEDPRPGEIFKKRIRLSAAKQRIKKGKKEPVVKVSNRPRVVVTGRNYCNILTMVRSLGEAGYDVDILRVLRNKRTVKNILTTMNPESFSRYASKYVECIATEDRNVVDHMLKMAEAGEKLLLIPVDDYAASVVDQNYDELKNHFVIPNIGDKQGEICRLMDKNEQKSLAKEFGLPMLTSVLVKSSEGKYELPEGIVYPCFIKPNVSMKSTKATMKRCENEEELTATLDRYAQKGDFEMLVEEFVDIKHEYSILGFSSGMKVCAPGIFKATEGGHRERKGVSITGETVDDTPFRSLIDQCGEFVKSLDYMGLFDVDLIETTSGEVYFIELNLRGGASIHLFTKAGVNLPGMMADYVVKECEPNENDRLKDIGKSFVSEKVLIEEFARSDADDAKVKRLIEKADVTFVEDKEDMQPYFYFKKMYPVANMLRVPYKIRDGIKQKEKAKY